jgi:hypothetical protein
MAGNKRPADDLDFDIDDYITADSYCDKDNSVPQIIRRHHSRLKPPGSLPPWTLASEYLPESSLQGVHNSDALTPYPVTPRPPFNIFKAILRHPNLFFQFALRLPVDTMMDLYAIDKEFHYRLNKYSISILYDHALYHAPIATSVFSPVLYPDLVISDPVLKPMDGRVHLARDIPSFRWTKMVFYRDRVVREILTMLALEGHRVPAQTETVLCKFWVIMELRTQALREAFLRDPLIWSNDDIHIFQLFLTKLDMRFSHPVQGQGSGQLSHMLLTQKSLTALRDVLAGKWWTCGGGQRLDYQDVEEMVIKTYVSDDLDTDTHPWLDDEIENDIPPWLWGLLSRENFEVDGTSMDSCVDLVVFEGLRRRLHVQRWYLDFVLYGYVDVKSGKNIPAPRKWRGDSEIKVPERGWPGNYERKKLIEEFEESIRDSNAAKKRKERSRNPSPEASRSDETDMS